jgi:predicted nicotinamide N-methyase
MSASVNPRRLDFDHWLGPRIQDAFEETFLLFSESLPSQNLGFLDSKSGEIELDVGGRTFILKQSPNLLTSQRESGTTGAVLWKITPLVAEWLSTSPAILHDSTVLRPNSIIVELGCGITGLIGLVLASNVSDYVLTDQSYVMRTLQHNIESNATPVKVKGKKATNPANQPRAVQLDWENNAASLEGLGLQSSQTIDLVVVCDCVYNEYLVKPLVATLVDVCQLNNEVTQTGILIAQQLRSDTIFEQFLAALMNHFSVWRVTDEYLSADLHHGSGYALHIGVLRSSQR